MDNQTSAGDTTPLLVKDEESSIYDLGQTMTDKADFNKYHKTNLPGMIHGFEFPFTVEQVNSDKFGAAWVTKALRVSR